MRLLLLQHAARKNSGHIVSFVNDRHIDVDVLKMWESPDMEMPDATSYDGVIILGGTMNVHDDFSFLIKEVEFIRESIGRVPMLGLCLGAQLIAYALGATIKEDFEQRQVGFDTIQLTDAGKQHPLFFRFPENVKVLQWHGQTFDLPLGADRLATSSACANQAFAHGNAYGVQFHLEISPALGREIYAEGRAWAVGHTGFSEERFLADLDSYELIIKAQCYQLFDNFLKIIA